MWLWQPKIDSDIWSGALDCAIYPPSLSVTAIPLLISYIINKLYCGIHVTRRKKKAAAAAEAADDGKEKRVKWYTISFGLSVWWCRRYDSLSDLNLWIMTHRLNAIYHRNKHMEKEKNMCDVCAQRLPRRSGWIELYRWNSKDFPHTQK